MVWYGATVMWLIKEQDHLVLQEQEMLGDVFVAIAGELETEVYLPVTIHYKLNFFSDLHGNR